MKRGSTCIFSAVLGALLQHHVLVLSPSAVDSFVLIVPITPMTGPHREFRVNGWHVDAESTAGGMQRRHRINTREQVAKPVSSGATHYETASTKKNYDHGRLIVFSMAVVYALASGTIAPVNVQMLDVALQHVAEASLPKDSTDVWCIVLGECVGALSSRFLRGLALPLSITLLGNARRIKATGLAQVLAAEAVAETGSTKAVGPKMYGGEAMNST
jgi:hypothetical protein